MTAAENGLGTRVSATPGEISETHVRVRGHTPEFSEKSMSLSGPFRTHYGVSLVRVPTRVCRRVGQGPTQGSLTDCRRDGGRPVWTVS